MCLERFVRITRRIGEGRAPTLLSKNALPTRSGAEVLQRGIPRHGEEPGSLDLATRRRLYQAHESFLNGVFGDVGVAAEANEIAKQRTVVCIEQLGDTWHRSQNAMRTPKLGRCRGTTL